MKICVAQSEPRKGDIQHNIECHKKLIALAASNGAHVVIFPELSLTGYEPTLAKELAIHQDDKRLDEFQQISDLHGLTIGVGAPTKSSKGICISMILFQPHRQRRLYSKKYLHADEYPYFVSGSNFPTLNVNQTSIALAICYEISVPEHSENAHQKGAEIYIASVAKFVKGVDQAIRTLSEIARKYSMPVFMSNCVGQADGDTCGGKTSIWNSSGLLVGQLNERDEGILIFDTHTQQLID